MKNINGFLISVITILAITACNDNLELPAERPIAIASGFTHDARIRNATVRAYAIDDNALRTDELLGEGVSDNRGFYQIELQAPSQPILLETCNGNYTEEFSGVNVTLNQTTCLKAFTFYESGEPVSVMLTPLTTIAAGLVEHKVQNESLNINNAITEASIAISSIIGGIDIITTIPADLTTVDIRGQALTDSIRYAFYMAGISGFTAQANLDNNLSEHSTYTSIDFTTIAYNDIRADGMLNGIGFDSNGNNPGSNLGFGTVSIDANTYRAIVAQNMLRFIGNENNESTITVNDLLPSARSIADSTHGVFDNVTPLPVDEDAPIINLVNPEGTAFNGSINYAVTIEDFTIVESVEFFVDNVSLGQSTDKVNASIPILTTNYSEGEHTIRVVATDALGNEGTRDIQVFFYNEAPAINVTSSLKTNKTEYPMSGTYATSTGGMNFIRVNGFDADIEQDGTWSININLTPGFNNVVIDAQDELGNEITQIVQIGLDLNSPIIRVTTPIEQSNYFVEYSIETAIGPSIFLDLWKQNATEFVLHVPSERYSLNGLALTENNLRNNKYPYYRVVINDASNSVDVFSDTENIKVFLSYSVGGDLKINRNELLPSIRTVNDTIVANHNHIIPVSEEGLGNGWYLSTPNDEHLITIEAEDEAGNTTIKEFRFKIRTVTAPPEITTSELSIPEFDNTSFSDRANLDGATVEVFEYRFRNTSSENIFVSFNNTGSNVSVTNHVKTGIRENQGRLHQKTEWRVQTFKMPHSTFPCNIAVANISDWQIIERGSTTPITTSLNGNAVIFEPPEVEIGDLEILGSDTPVVPQNTEWTAVTSVLDNDSNSYAPTDFASLFLDNTRDNNGFSSLRTINCQIIPNWQERNLFEYVFDEGYPKNIYDSFTLTETGSSEINVTSLERGSIIPINGFYRIQPNETVIVVKEAANPVIQHFNDVDVFEEVGFSSYSLRQGDEFITWTYDRGLEVITVPDVGFDRINLMQPLSTIVEPTQRTIILTR